jgi:PAS domain S-box-containing protein
MAAFIQFPSTLSSLAKPISKRLMQDVLENERNHSMDIQQNVLDLYKIVTETDIRGKIIRANPQFLEICKYPLHELIGQDSRILNSGYHPKSFFRDMWETLSQRKVWTGEVRNRAKDGSIFWVRMVIGPITGADGNINRYLAIQRDITKEKEIHERLREAELRYRELLDEVNLLAIGLDVNGEVRFMNAAAARLFNHHSGSLIGKDWFTEILPAHETDEALRIFAGTLASARTSEPYEIHFQNGFGEPRTIKMKNAPFRDAQGDLAGVTLLGEDITESKKNQLEIQRLKDQAEQRREELIGFISHELRSPVASILVGIDLLHRFTENGSMLDSSVTPQEVLDRMKMYAEKILRVSRDFLEVSSRSSGSMSYSLKPANLKDILDRVCLAFKGELSERPSIDLLREDSADGLWGLWDDNRLEQVFSNIISNAVKYSKPEGGPIRVRSERRNGSALVSIQDSGIGIPKAELEKIFDSFVRAENVQGLPVEGFGLGLKIAKDIVEHHGGKIWAESQLGEGSTFFVELPLSK